MKTIWLTENKIRRNRESINIIKIKDLKRNHKQPIYFCSGRRKSNKIINIAKYIQINQQKGERDNSHNCKQIWHFRFRKNKKLHQKIANKSIIYHLMIYIVIRILLFKKEIIVQKLKNTYFIWIIKIKSHLELISFI